MEPVSTALILKSLDALSMRATVTAHNIANANSPDFRPMKVTFEDALRRAAETGVSAISAVAPRTVAAIDEEGRSELRLDLELATATSTAGRYGTLADILNRQMQIQALAMRGER